MNMMSVIQPKSDQINADDLIGGPRTIVITDVKISAGTEQPVSMGIDGDAKVFRPCKSMSRVLVAAWGPDAKQYVGRSLTLYRDADVMWGGMKVGGIRISHMSDIERDMTMALTETRAKRKPYTVRQIKDAPAATAKPDAAQRWADAYIEKLPTLATVDAVAAFEAEKSGKLAELANKRPDLHEAVLTALSARYAALANDGTLSEDNPAATEGRGDEDMGDGFEDDEPERITDDLIERAGQ